MKNSKPLKVLITGIKGFLGSHIAQACAKEGYDVYGIARGDIIVHHAKIFYGDILDEEFTRDCTNGMDVVIHLAAVTEHDKLVNHEKTSTDFNIISTENILSGITQNSGCLFIFPSSGKVYGKPESLPYTEMHKTNPSTILGRMKLEIEKTIESHALQDEHNKYVILRVFNVYGPGQKETFLVPTILRQILRQKKEKIILGDIISKRDYVYIDDVTSAFVMLIKEQKKLDQINVYNLSSNKSYSAGEIAGLIAEELDTGLLIDIDEKKLRPDEFDEEKADYSKLKNNVGWTPKTSMKEGIKKTIEKFT